MGPALAVNAAASAPHPAPSAAAPPSSAENEVQYLDVAAVRCVHRLLADPGCCADDDENSAATTGVRSAAVARPAGRLWWPEGTHCKTPRVLYLHGGTLAYAQSSSLVARLAKAADALVFSPDHSMDTTALLLDLQWLQQHNPGGRPCDGASHTPALFVAGDGAGGGTALSLLLRLQQEARLTTMVVGFVGFSPWTNLACDTPTYYNNAFAEVVGKAQSQSLSYVGDIVEQAVPRNSSTNLAKKAKALVAGAERLLRDPVASPLYASNAQLALLPPLYFAVAGAELRLGDTVILAQRAARQGVSVVQDIFDGMWHGFPRYADGCSASSGGGSGLWQGRAVFARAGAFVRQLARIAELQPELLQGGSHRKGPLAGADSNAATGHGAGKTPRTSIHYPYPAGRKPWVDLQPLVLDVGLERLSAKKLQPPTPAPVAAEVAEDSGTAVSAEEERKLADKNAASATAATAALHQRRLQQSPQKTTRSGCQSGTLVGAYATGAVGGAMTVLMIITACWYWLTKYGDCSHNVVIYSLVGGPGAVSEGGAGGSAAGMTSDLGLWPWHEMQGKLAQLRGVDSNGVARPSWKINSGLKDGRRLFLNHHVPLEGSIRLDTADGVRVICIICAFDYEGYGADVRSGLCRLQSTDAGRRLASLARACGAEVIEFYDSVAPEAKGFPKREAVLSELRRAGRRLYAGDTLVFSFTGHAMERATADAPVEELCFVDPDGTYAPVSGLDLLRLLVESFGHDTNVVMLTDRCQTGVHVGLCSGELGNRPVCHLAAMRDRLRMRQRREESAVLLPAIMQSLEEHPKNGLHFSVAAMYNTLFQRLGDNTNQDVALECSPGVNPDNLAWPLSPPAGLMTRLPPFASAATTTKSTARSSVRSG